MFSLDQLTGFGAVAEELHFGGLGVTLDRDARDAAHKLYLTQVLHRDDAIAMQYLVKDWQFDPKRPCLVR